MVEFRQIWSHGGGQLAYLILDYKLLCFICNFKPSFLPCFDVVANPPMKLLSLRYKPGTGNVMADQSYGTKREAVALATRDRRQPQFRGHGVPPPDQNLSPGPIGHEMGPPHHGPTPEPESFTIKVSDLRL